MMQLTVLVDHEHRVRGLVLVPTAERTADLVGRLIFSPWDEPLRAILQRLFDRSATCSVERPTAAEDILSQHAKLALVIDFPTQARPELLNAFGDLRIAGPLCPGRCERQQRQGAFMRDRTVARMRELSTGGVPLHPAHSLAFQRESLPESFQFRFHLLNGAPSGFQFQFHGRHLVDRRGHTQCRLQSTLSLNTVATCYRRRPAQRPQKTKS
mmetsp:Transcript_22087/g.68925  ORF Transcript_22087/g.68925 Transcript_22087/m.68925 type:complete len:212 (+) Transcript_22087:1175-1810(+)